MTMSMDRVHYNDGHSSSGGDQGSTKLGQQLASSQSDQKRPHCGHLHETPTWLAQQL